MRLIGPTGARAACRAEASGTSRGPPALVAARAGVEHRRRNRAATTMPNIPAAAFPSWSPWLPAPWAAARPRRRTSPTIWWPPTSPGTTATASACCRTMCGCSTPACWCPTRHSQLVADHGGVLVFDARRGFGQAMAKEAMRRGIERARAQGSVVGGPAQQRAYRPDRALGRAVRGCRHGLGPLRQRRRPRPDAGAVRLQRRPARHQPVRRRRARCGRRARARCSTWRPARSLSARRGSRATRACRCPRRADRRARPADHRSHHLCRHAPGRPARLRRPQGLGPGHPVRGAGRRGDRRRHHRPASRAQGRHPQQHAVVHPRRRPRSATRAHRGRDGGGRRLGQGFTARSRLRRDPVAGRARAAGARAPRWPRACRSTTRAWPISWPPAPAWA